MRCIKSISVIVFLTSIFLIILYSTLHLELSHSVRASLQDLQNEPDLNNAAKNSFKEESLNSPLPDVNTVTVSQGMVNFDFHDFSVSQGFREIIPQNGGYWNRLLFSALRSLDNRKNPLINKLPWLGCRQENQQLLQINVHDFNSYPDLFQSFLQGMNCMSPPVLINQPNKCIPKDKNGDKQTFLLFAIKSTPRNFERRQAVRETWGREGEYQNGLRVRTVFLLGSTSMDDPDLSALLSYEAKHFGDLLQWDFHDSFFNLTLKMSVFMKWTLKNCPQVSFIFSGDDDVFVNTPLLLTYLQSLEASKASQLYVGQIISSASPHRDSRNKYYIPQSFYDGPYPAYAGGGGFVFSGALMQPLFLASHVIPFYPIDDVYMGMLFRALEVSAEAHTGFQTFDVKQQDRANVCVHKGHILVHQRFPQEIKKIWNAINSPMLTC
ncbi:N-acetyllactosaminide beta-1,3-N-acetylglucosaminyltransferase 2 [Melanotaenia boesemani]|uniref:N-acetyllactosaminide beta-1,3-N-acetylglucosaminyltransferase 2 n=1 Tax=Melanotaenia boesemani TaxID=1250792 RepID=UPI001C03C7DA|nr:N-acetyllactosaminide beta-1,3-N-acetylglucosaminyltransferase 2 [Melanotaenia boesemani]XP_041851804.1 N-acetyllactosaminide beta-1,3-N-acetylglucosaminyltransferase 2 [Melanotaenia boesemani]